MGWRKGQVLKTAELRQQRTRNRHGNFAWHRISRNWELYLMILPVFLFFIVFHYVPMYGIQIAFKNFSGVLGIWGSPWAGVEHFIRFFNGTYFKEIVWNTISISVYSLLVGFPVPIILALMLNEVRNARYKKLVQTVTYAQHRIQHFLPS